MLTHLQLRDLVLVDQAELELESGLTALTGETGAGKSIIVDALLLIAGGRAGGDIVRQGAERAEVAASFDALPTAAKAWLENQAIDYDGELVLRRVIGADGRSRAYVNGQMVPIQALREVAEFLIDIHGQQEFQRLVNRGAQRDMLDEHLADQGLREAVSKLYERYRTCRRDFEALKSAAENRDSRLDLLRYQLAELKAEVTTVSAIEELLVDRKRIAGRGRLAEAARTALAAAYESDGGSAHDLLARAQAALRQVGDTDPELASMGKLLAEAMINTREAADGLRRYLDVLDIDPARQEEIERHTAALEALARKHRVGVLDLPEQLLRTEQELAALDNAQVSLGKLELELEALTRDYRASAERLTAGRQGAAEHLGRHITQLMQALGMEGGRFAVSVNPSEAEFGANGSDEVEFLVSANPGQAPKSLARVASGGELSRISLAVQVAAAARASALCMVFDEVDAGIGGAVAEIVGRQLRELGERAQVLCVTHLAQVASQAHSQFRVTKLTDGKITRTAVKALSSPERVDEIARMLGGVDISEQARAHARDMLARAAPAEAAAKKKRAPAARR
ncbi:MAG TPA: DNA repair protein RecN [Steroidobacteraceae bacterium]|nr:DNA repair protein RecN [Steroidobacteraceae bacterium]